MNNLIFVLLFDLFFTLTCEHYTTFTLPNIQAVYTGLAAVCQVYIAVCMYAVEECTVECRM